ncbi:aflatoxin regulatory protein-domain-containing protein [Aspergillus crustosus]
MSVNSQPVPPLSDTSSATNSQQPRKLRDSCIHCANSKVRCNKEKPICGRCARRRLPCEYKVSRRTGRTSRASNTLSVGAAALSTGPMGLEQTDIAMNTTASARSESFDISGSSQTSLPTPNSTMPAPLYSPVHSVHETPDLWHSFLSPSAMNDDFSSLISLTADVGDVFGAIPESPGFNQCDVDRLAGEGFGRSDLIAEHTLLPTPAASSVDSWSSGVNSAACCLTTVVNILTTLFPSTPATCNHAGNGRTPSGTWTPETVVSENRQVVESISHVLDCSCSHDPYIISIVSLVVFKVMGRYSAAARTPASAMDHGRGYESAMITQHNERNPYGSDEHTSHTPTISGGYCADIRNQNRMVAQLVLGELHGVQRLVNALSSRVESFQLRDCHCSASLYRARGSVGTIENALAAAVQSSPLSSSTFSHLEGDLRNRLRAISAETIEMLRQT